MRGRWAGFGRAFLGAIVVLTTVMPAAGQGVAPYKDRLFTYPAAIERSADGAFSVFAYSEARDLDQRDDVPERRVRDAYVDLSVNRSRRERRIEHEGGAVDLYEVGAAGGATFAVIFVHGRGGDRSLGDDDWTFGGNFNRLKNLAARNGGTYYVPSLPDFGAAGMAGMNVLIDHIARVSPGAPIVLACASMGSLLCWQSAAGQRAAHLDGLVILGGATGRGFTASEAFHLRVPLYLAHGSEDTVYDWPRQKAFFDAVRQADGGYPIRFALFDTGTHGTPIRMVDWREVLNWIGGQRR